jgi:hypothetical protein
MACATFKKRRKLETGNFVKDLLVLLNILEVFFNEIHISGKNSGFVLRLSSN